MFPDETDTTEPCELLQGQSTVGWVSLMLGKDKVSISDQTKHGFWALVCHRALKTKIKGGAIKKSLGWKWLEVVNSVAAQKALQFVNLPADGWQSYKTNCSWQKDETQPLALGRNIQLSRYWKMLRLWVVSFVLSTLGRLARDVITAAGPLFFTCRGAGCN